MSEADRQALGIGNRRAALLNDNRWPLASTIRIRFLEGDRVLQQRVRDAAEGWLYDRTSNRPLANLRFNFVPSGDSEIRIAFRRGNGAWSFIGTFCRQFAPDEPTMNFGWITPESREDEIRSVVLHEFGHALGLIHEHQNPQQAISWNEPAVIADLSEKPNRWDLATIHHNVLDRYDPAKVTATDVDATSIMMYPIPESWTNGTFSSDFSGDLSAIDKQFIRTCYP